MNNYQDLVQIRQSLLEEYDATEIHCDKSEWAAKRNELRQEIHQVTKDLMGLYDKKTDAPTEIPPSRIKFKIKKTDGGKWRFDIYTREHLLLLKGKEFVRRDAAENFVNNIKMNALTATIEYINKKTNNYDTI